MSAVRLLIAEARFYDGILDALKDGAIAAAQEAGCSWELVTVPGALELPGVIALAARSGRFDAFAALGCVLRGETSHYDTVCNESARGLMQLTIDPGLAIGNGILTCETERQAWVRARRNQGDKGGGAVRAALALLDARRRFGQ
jgi:6,7-dimethyl-8-ribityllumazine synthase